LEQNCFDLLFKTLRTVGFKHHLKIFFVHGSASAVDLELGLERMVLYSHVVVVGVGDVRSIVTEAYQKNEIEAARNRIFLFTCFSLYLQSRKELW